MRLAIRWAAVLAFFPVAFAAHALAAQDASRAPVRTAALFGSVLSDPHDIPVEGAEIVVMPGAGSRSNARGDFTITGITPGVHTVLIRHLGHRAISATVMFSPGGSASVASAGR